MVDTSSKPSSEERDEKESSKADGAATDKPASTAPVVDPMRAYRACLHCRSRKTKCNLDANGGRPPCKRCQRENRECVLGESHRGGRRVRKKPKLESEDGSSSQNHNTSAMATPTAPSFRQDHVSTYPEPPGSNSSPYHPSYNNAYNPSSPWQGPVGSYPGQSESRPPLRTVTGRRQEDVTSAELHNPSDALGILANVADSAENGQSNGGSPRLNHAMRMKSWVETMPSEKVPTDFAYQPVLEGKISPKTVYELFDFYQRYYHPYMPIVPKETFHRPRIPWMSKAQPHLFAAIMTVASKDDLLLHQICHTHMQSLISEVVSGADADMEVVEALLLLSQWMCQRPQTRSHVGRGEEDRVAWMYIGIALRIGWYLGIDRASFGDTNDPKFIQKRLVWTACYIADRNVSIRLGKGFWARGPGPLTDKTTSEFPTLAPTAPGEDDLEKVFKAHLGLTQLFSNVHDILYSSKGMGWKEMLEGRYAKYLDDFRMSIRNWHDSNGKLECSDSLKGTLRMSYDYLRLYVNAFAYQATISRAMRDAQKSKTPNETIPLLDSSAADARFIYEAIDAAKSLLTTVTDFVPPEVLRYMPCRYYMYIVYSAVFLYKARSTTTMSFQEGEEVRQLITATIDVLSRSVIGANQIGTRYAKLLDMLWKKAPPKVPHQLSLQHSQSSHGSINGTGAAHGQLPNQQSHPTNIDHRLLAPTNNLAPPHQNPYHNASSQPMQQQYDAHPYIPASNFLYPPDPTQAQHVHDTSNGMGGAFSWLDLPAAYGFATQNLQMHGEDVDLHGPNGVGGNGNSAAGGLEMGWSNPHGMHLGVVGVSEGLEESAEGMIF